MEGAYNPNHPGALAHLDPPPLSASIVADLICAGLNNNLLAEELSPSLSRLERGLCAWMAEAPGPAGRGRWCAGQRRQPQQSDGPGARPAGSAAWPAAAMRWCSAVRMPMCRWKGRRGDGPAGRRP